MLAKSQPNLLDIGNDNDSDIYDGSSSLRSGTSTNTLNEDEIEREHKGKHKVSNVSHFLRSIIIIKINVISL